jgi:hypothetical protein
MHAVVCMRKSKGWVQLVSIMFLQFGMMSGTHAAPNGAQFEINYLLSYLGSSGCDFYRNGSWYAAKTAREHLQKKFNYYDKRSLINSSEDFIARAATSSSISGEMYMVRCPKSSPVTSASWLNSILQRYRVKASQTTN